MTFQRVTCEAKVVSVDEVEEVSGGKKKQDVLLGDSTIIFNKYILVKPRF